MGHKDVNHKSNPFVTDFLLIVGTQKGLEWSSFLGAWILDVWIFQHKDLGPAISTAFFHKLYRSSVLTEALCSFSIDFPLKIHLSWGNCLTLSEWKHFWSRSRGRSKFRRNPLLRPPWRCPEPFFMIQRITKSKSKPLPHDRVPVWFLSVRLTEDTHFF